MRLMTNQTQKRPRSLSPITTTTTFLLTREEEEALEQERLRTLIEARVRVQRRDDASMSTLHSALHKREMERTVVIVKHASVMLPLADAALAAVRALMAAERVAKVEAAEDYALYGDDECSIEDAERALVIIRTTAFDAVHAEATEEEAEEGEV
jgi:hypothetical protein